MSDSANRVPSPKPPSRKRRWLRWVILAFLFAIAFPFAWEFYARRQARSALDRAIADVERVDPRWRLDEIEADRREIAPEKNSAPLVVASYQLLPKFWFSRVHEEIDKLPPHVALLKSQAERIEQELQPLAAALKKARQLQDFPQGRHRTSYTSHFILTSLEDQYSVRQIAMVLDLDVAWLLHRRELKQAWNSNRAQHNVARSLGDEPRAISMVGRLDVTDMSVRNLQRILGHGELGREHLQERRQALREEMAVSPFLIGMRGDRAIIHKLLTDSDKGFVSLVRSLDWSGTALGPWWSAGSPVVDFFATSAVLRAHAVLLELETKAIEAAKLPPVQRFNALEDLDVLTKSHVRGRDRSKKIVGLLLPGIRRFAEIEMGTRTRMGCALAGLAAEEFRIANGRWPNSLNELVKCGLLKEVPADFVDGKPLRFRRSQDGVVIFSMGPDGKYQGTALDATETGEMNPGDWSERSEFRLWDVEHRRKRPPVPRVP